MNTKTNMNSNAHLKQYKLLMVNRSVPKRGHVAEAAMLNPHITQLFTTLL
jgi:hypothetical protein